MKPLINLKDVSFDYYTNDGETSALKNVSLDISQSDFISIVGPSGCGKTTLLSVISGLLKPTNGIIEYNSNNAETNEAPKNFFGYMFQRDQLFEWRTVWQNVILGLEIQHLKTPENLAYVESLLEKYGLSEFKNARPSELSGGMRQRAALIRTLALKPEVLLLDEPFSALDYQTRINVCNDVADIIKRENKTAVLVTHDIEEALSMANKIVILTKRPGQIKQIVKLNHDENSTPLSRREKIEISKWQKLIWKEEECEK